MIAKNLHTEAAAEPAAGLAPDYEGADLWKWVLRRKWLIVFCLVVGGGLGVLYYFNATPMYESMAEILILRKEAKSALSGVQGEVSYEDTLSTHTFLMTSPLIVQSAVEKFKLDQLPSLAGTDATAAIISGLVAERAVDSSKFIDPNVVLLRYEGLNPKDCAKVLEAVVQSYEDFLGQMYRNVSEEMVSLLQQGRDELQEDLDKKEAAYASFRQDSPLLWQDEKGANLHDLRMSGIEEQRALAQLSNAQIRSRIDMVDEALKGGGRREALMLLAGNARKPLEPLSMEQQLFAAMVEEQVLQMQYGAEHPQTRAASKKVSAMRALTLGSGPWPIDPNTGEQVDFLSVYVESLRQELQAGEQQLKELDKLFEQERKDAKSLAMFQVRDEAYRKEILRAQQLFDGVVQGLQQINMATDYGGVSAQVIAPPRIGEQVEPSPIRVAAVAGLLSLLAGLGLAYVVDMADRNFRSPDEIRQALGAPIVAHIPVLSSYKPRRGTDGSKPRMHPTLHAHYRPGSREAEAYRAARTALFFGSEAGQRVVQITSPSPNDGKSTLAANLAVTMAQSGKKVLLIDADFRQPTLHKLFGLEVNAGLSCILAGTAEPFDVIQSTDEPNLSVLTCGRERQHPSEQLTSTRLKELLEAMRNQYDFVLVDTPPLLAVTDPAVVASRVDGVLLILRLGKRARTTAQRAVELLASVGARVAGIVVNGVRDTRSYNYGGHSYLYGYGDGEAAYYLRQTEEPAAAQA